MDLAAHTVKFGLWLPRPGVAEVDSAPTSGLLVRREDWEWVRGIPEEGMLGDTLFCWALVDAGVRLHLVGEAVFEHDHGATYRGLMRERFARGREFARLRRQRWPGSGRRAQDVATTVSLLRPTRVTARSAAAARRHAGLAEAVVTLPVVASAQFAWFAGELAGMARDRAGTGR
jgi:GT2 family glycosyltransferase